MQYYKLTYDYENDSKAIFLNIDEKTLKIDRYDVNKGQVLNVNKILCSKQKQEYVYTDYVANNLVWLVVSERIKNILLKFNIGQTQFIPVIDIDSNEKIGYLVNVINTINAIDLSKSLYKKLKYNKDGKDQEYISVIKYALIKDKIIDNDLFKLENFTLPIFVSERLKRAFDDAHITGCHYLKVVTC